MMHMSTHLFLRFPHLPAQIEQHLNPSAVARKPFLLLAAAAATAPATATTSLENEDTSSLQHHQHHHHHHHGNQHIVLLDVSPEAEAQGIDTSMTLSHITTHFPPPAVIQIPAATWAPTTAAAAASTTTLTSFSQSSLPPLLPRDVALAAYKEAAEKAPVRLLRKLVEGEGLVLLEEEDEEGNGNTTIGNYRVALSAEETSSSSFSSLQQEQQQQQAKDLGQYLSAELERLLGYQLIFEVMLSKGEEVNDSSSKRKRKEATTEQAQEKEEEADAHGAGAGPGEGEVLEEEEEEVEVVEEYICEHCRAFFFDAVALVEHVEKTHLATNTATNHQQQQPLPPSSAAATTKTRTRPSSRGGHPLPPPPPPPPPQVQGPGTHSFIEALTTLTDQKDIEAFLTRIGAPLPAAAARTPSPPSPG